MMKKGKNEEFSIVIEEKNNGVVNPLSSRDLVKLYIIDENHYNVIGTDFPHKYKSIEEAVKSINKQENVVMYLYFDEKSNKYVTETCNCISNMLLIGLVTCSKRVIRTVWHELQRAKKEDVVNKAVSVVYDEIKLMNDWFKMKIYDVKIFKEDSLFEEHINVMASNETMLFEKIEMLSLTPNIKVLLKKNKIIWRLKK